MSCPACNKLNTPETGVPFPTESSRLVRYCLLLNIDPKTATTNKNKFLICFDHFEPKHLVKRNGKVTGVTPFAVPLKTKKQEKDMNTKRTLDQLLAQNVGIGITNVATTSSCSISIASSNQPIGIGRPLQSQTNSTGTTVPSLTLSKLANRTLVLYRQKKPGSSPAWSLLYFREWLLNSFNLPTKAIHEQSQIINVADLCLNFLLLDEEQTIETILTMYKSTSPNKYQCMLDSATNVLMDGCQILKKQQKGGERNSTNDMNLAECFGLLIPSIENNSPNSNAVEMEIDDDQNAWNNIAAAGREVHLNSPAVKFYGVSQRMHYFRTEFLQRLKQIFEQDDDDDDEHQNFQIMPVYRNILMAASSSQAQQDNNIASTSNLPIPSFATTMMNPTTSSQQIDKTNRHTQPSKIPSPR